MTKEMKENFFKFRSCSFIFQFYFYFSERENVCAHTSKDWERPAE